MTLYGDAIGALRARLLVIGATGLLSGIAGFIVGCTSTPRIDVVGYVDIARLAYVDALGNFNVELVALPAVLAGQVNSGAFFQNADEASAESGLRRAGVIARVPPRGDNIELSVRVHTVSEGMQALSDMVRRMDAVHRAQQQPAIERLRKRLAAVQAEIEELTTARRQLDKMFSVAGSGGARDSMQHYFLASLRAQSNREMRELERLRDATADAIERMEERRTRVVGNLMPRRASLLVPLAIGILASVAATLLATALVVLLALRRGVRTP